MFLKIISIDNHNIFVSLCISNMQERLSVYKILTFWVLPFRTELLVGCSIKTINLLFASLLLLSELSTVDSSLRVLDSAVFAAKHKYFIYDTQDDALGWAFRQPRLYANIVGIGHFRVPPGLCFKTRVGAQPLIFFILMQITLIFTRKVVHLASF